MTDQSKPAIDTTTDEAAANLHAFLDGIDAASSHFWNYTHDELPLYPTYGELPSTKVGTVRAVLADRDRLAARVAEMEFDHMLARRQAVLEVMGERDHWRSLAVAAQARVEQLESDRDEDTRVFARWTGAADGSDEERAAAALAVRIADRVTDLADRTAPVPCVWTATMTDVRTTYRVAAKRWAKGWELNIEGVGVTQARRPAEFREMARDLIVRRTGVPSAVIALTWVLDGATAALLPDERALLAALASLGPCGMPGLLDALQGPRPGSSSHGKRRRWRTRSAELFRAWMFLRDGGLVRVGGTEGRTYLYEITAAGRDALDGARKGDTQ